jgi:hypothetical protein
MFGSLLDDKIFLGFATITAGLVTRALEITNVTLCDAGDELVKVFVFVWPLITLD